MYYNLSKKEYNEYGKKFNKSKIIMGSNYAAHFFINVHSVLFYCRILL